MAQKRQQNTYQYAPLVVPANWRGDERQFSIHLSQLLDDLYRKYGALAKESSVLNAYPVGSIYISLDSTSPATLFGGTWEQIKDTFLLAAGSTYAAGSTGGEATHKLTESEMPNHNHVMEYTVDGGETYANLLTGKDGTSTPRDYYGGMSTAVTGFVDYRSRIGYTGGSTAHNNMPPYLTVYMWKRTA